MDKIACPRCKAQIMLIPDLKEMTVAIGNHIEHHTNEMQTKKMPTSEISRQKSDIENALTKEVIKKICEKHEQTWAIQPLA
jgi:hypothetical protein